MSGAEINLLAGVISAFVSTLLIASAWHKWQDLPLFRSHIEAYGLLPGKAADVATYVLPVLEVTAAVLMWLPVASAACHGLALALLVVYAAAMAINVLQGRTDLECGCGGPSQRVGWGLILRNLVLAALTGLAGVFAGHLEGALAFATAIGAGVLLWMLYALIEKVWGFMAKAKSFNPATSN
ncbi:MAG TPA: MauE/DoxX family redox-associated membrane protein [Comamonas sp.]